MANDQTGSDEKRAIRRSMRDRLAAITPSEAQRLSARIIAWLAGSDVFGEAGVVALYAASAGEPDLDGLARLALRAGKRVAWPRMDWEAAGMAMVAMDRHDWAAAGLGEVRRHGVAEPGADGPVVSPAELMAEGLVLVPGLAFDRAGGRLGRGAGFYDRFLASLPDAGPEAGARSRGAIIGVGFACQLVDRVPMSERDVAVHGIVTEDGLMMV